VYRRQRRFISPKQGGRLRGQRLGRDEIAAIVSRSSLGDARGGKIFETEDIVARWLAAGVPYVDALGLQMELCIRHCSAAALLRRRLLLPLLLVCLLLRKACKATHQIWRDLARVEPSVHAAKLAGSHARLTSSPPFLHAERRLFKAMANHLLVQHLAHKSFQGLPHDAVHPLLSGLAIVRAGLRGHAKLLKL
jgi:hypothetical protein